MRAMAISAFAGAQHHEVDIVEIGKGLDRTRN